MDDQNVKQTHYVSRSGKISVPHVLKKVASIPRLQPTISDTHVSLVFREKFCYNGYRLPYQSWWYYIASLFQIHNESGNIWSHLIATALFIYKTYDASTHVDYWTEPLSWAFVAFSFGAIGYAALSTLAHLFHSKSELMHYTCFQIDFVGIGLNSFGNACLLYYLTGTETFYSVFSGVYLILNVIFAVLVCVCCGVSNLLYSKPYPPQRYLWMAGSASLHVAFGGLPLFCMFCECLFDESCTISTIYPHLRYMFWFATSGIFFACGVPERFAPGKFDILAHGHQLFHVMVTRMTWIQYDVALHALKNRPRDLIKLAAPSATSIMAATAAVVVLDTMYIMYTHKYRISKVANDKNCKQD